MEVGVEAFPAPACEKLALPPEVSTWRGRREPPHPWPFRALPPPGHPHPARRPGKNPSFTIVNTDVDDTVIASLWDRDRYARGQRYPGALEMLAAQGQSLVVLTARPKLMESAVRRQFCGWYRAYSPVCEDIAVSPGELSNLVDTLGMGLVKAEALLAQREEHPDAATVFNGDSGQGDWIAALILRDIDPEGVPYAAIHDVRAWSLEHRIELRDELLESERLAGIYRRAYTRRQGEAQPDHDARIDGHLRKIRRDIEAALTGPRGRLDGAFLKQRNIFLHRSYAALALDLAAAGFISDDSADRVLRAAVPGLCFAPDNELGFDAKDERDRLIARLKARVVAQAALARAAE